MAVTKMGDYFIRVSEIITHISVTVIASYNRFVCFDVLNVVIWPCI